MGALDGLRDEIKLAQKALRDQAQANELERDRLRKERERLEAQGSQTTAQNTQASAPQPTATNTGSAAESDKK